MKNLWKRIGVVAALLFSVSIPVALNVHADVTTPTVVSTTSKDGVGKQTVTVVVAANDIVVALVASDGPYKSGSKATVAGGLALVKRANASYGESEVWATKAAAAGNLTVSSTVGNYSQAFTVVVFRGSSGIGASAGASKSSGAPSVTVPATTGSLVYAVGNDWDNAIARTPVGGQSLVHQWVNTKTGDTLWSQRLNAAASGSTAISDASTPDQFNYVGVEILPGGDYVPPTTTTIPTTVPTPTTLPATTVPTTSGPTTVPSPTTTVPTGSTCAPLPSRCGYPDSTNTGPPAGKVLKRVPEDLTSGPGWYIDPRGWIEVDTAGTVIDGIITKLTVDIQANNVTVKNSDILVGFDDWAVAARHVTGTIVDHNNLHAINGTNQRGLVAVKTIYGDEHNTTVTANNIWNFGTGVQIYAGLIQDNYIHDMGFVAGDHINGTTSNGGMTEQLNILHNTVFNQIEQTDAISLFEDFGVEANRRIENNLVAGGGYCIYGGQNAGGPTATNIKILNNRFSRMYYPNCGSYGYLAAFGSGGSGNSFWNNVWDEGGSVPNEGTPPPTPTNCAAVPSACGYPDGTNTGPPAGTALTAVPGQLTSGPGWAWESNFGRLRVTGSNAVLDKLSISGPVVIDAPYATLTNSVVNSCDTEGDIVAVRAGNPSNGYNGDYPTINHNRLICTNTAQRSRSGIRDVYGAVKGLTASFNEITGTGNGITIENEGIATDNWIHDLGHLTGDHHSGVSTHGGAKQIIYSHNTLLLANTPTSGGGGLSGAITSYGDFGHAQNMTADNNFVSGGAYTVYGGINNEATYGNPTNIKFRNNRYICGSWVYGPAFLRSGTGNEFSGNFCDSNLSVVNP